MTGKTTTTTTTDKTNKQIKNHRLIPFINVDKEILNKLSSNPTQQYKKGRIISWTSGIYPREAKMV